MKTSIRRIKNVLRNYSADIVLDEIVYCLESIELRLTILENKLKDHNDQ